MLNPIIVFLGGIAYALTGYLKNAAKSEKFNASKMLKTILLAGLIAVVNHLSGAAAGFEDLSQAFASGAAETVLLEYLLKASLRFLQRVEAH